MGWMRAGSASGISNFSPGSNGDGGGMWSGGGCIWPVVDGVWPGAMWMGIGTI